MNKSIACNITALTEEQRHQRAALFHQLEQSAQEIRELDNGYTFCYAPKSDSWMTAATFVDLERRCCPFFTFSLSITPKDRCSCI